MPTTFDRRDFLRRAGITTAAVAAFSAGAPRPAARADESLAPFSWGVASGDPRRDAVILWTRVDPALGVTVPLSWVVAHDVELTDVVASGTGTTDATRDHTFKIDVAGLQPATWYFYGFVAADGRRSLTGRTKTAPAGPAERLRFAVVSCSNYQGGFFNAYARIAERNDLDAVLHLGDYIYEYGNGADRYGPGGGATSEPRDHQPTTEMVTLVDYRTRHAWYRLDPDLRRLHQLYPFVVTWDDHESTNNSWREGAENHEPDAPDYPNELGVAWADRKAWSQQAYSEWLPLRAEDPARIWRSLPYGDLAEIIVLDTRLERDEEVGVVGLTLPYDEIDNPERIMMSVEQREFLFSRLASTTATWKVIAQQVILAQWNGGGLPDLAPLAGQQDFPQFLRDGGNALNPDQWDGYNAERDRLFDHITGNGIDNVVVLTGDVHTSWANDLTPDPYNPLVYNPTSGEGALGVEFVTPSITSANFENLGPAGVAAAEQGTKADNPHVKYVDFDDHGYFILDLDAARAQADWYYVDTVLQPSDAERHAAAWKSDAGANHVSRAAAPAPAGAPAPATPAAAPPPPRRAPSRARASRNR